MGKDFGDFLKSIREQRGLTLRQVEEQAQISNAYLSQIERGERGIPNFSILERLAKVYGVPISELADAAEREGKGKSLESDKLLPDVQFVSRGYEKLSDKNKEHLTAFLQHLVSQEKSKKSSKSSKGNKSK